MRGIKREKNEVGTHRIAYINAPAQNGIKRLVFKGGWSKGPCTLALWGARGGSVEMCWRRRGAQRVFRPSSRGDSVSAGGELGPATYMLQGE